MASSIMHVSKGVKKTWEAMGKRQKTVIAAGISLVFLAFLIILLYVQKGARYETLWSNLDPLDAQGIVQELERQSIPYELTQGGRAVMVPEDQVYKLRLSLASQGLPASGIVGLESIGQGGIWATDFERRVQYIRAISGELTRTVKEITGVQEARVHVVLSEPSVFQTQSKPATAAVMLKPVPGYEIPASAVKGIVNLVSCSVEGLSPQDVAVIDSQGRLLSQNNQGPLGDLGSVSLGGYELVASVEKDLETRLTQLLSTVLGAGNVVCQVRAELALDQVHIQDVKYQKEQEPVVRSQEERTEDFKGSGTGPGGPAGGLDVPTYGTGDQGESEYRLRETLTNYEVGETTTETLVSPGQVNRLSVAVVVNKDLDDKEKESVQQTVTAALGLDPERRDTINVTGIPFDTTLSQKVDAALTPAPENPFKRFYIYGIAVGLALILGTVIIFLTRRQNGHEEELSPPRPPFPEVREEVIPDESARSAQQSVEKMARSNPATVAALLKSWILEDDR